MDASKCVVSGVLSLISKCFSEMFCAIKNKFDCWIGRSEINLSVAKKIVGWTVSYLYDNYSSEICVTLSVIEIGL